METPRKMPVKKLKSVNVSQLASSAASSSVPAASSFAYKHFNSANGKRRKNRKKYFEHDTRTRTIRTSVATSGTPNAAAAIKKIKFNNEIRIVETKCNNNDVDGSRGKMRKNKKLNNKHASNNNNNSVNGTNATAQKKRAKQQFRRITSAASNAANIQSTTQKLQKQLIETQKKLQQQLNALQEHQREQNNSFLALLHSNCAQMHANAKHDSNGNGCTGTNNATGAAAAAATVAANHHHQHYNDDHHDDQLTQANSSLTKSSSIASSTLLTKTNPNQSNPCSEHYFTHNFFTDQTKCSIDKMANGNKATAIR